MTAGTATIDSGALTTWLAGRRWFGSKSRELAGAEILDAPVIDAGPPELRIALVEARFATGAEAIYQVPVSVEVDGLREGERIAAFGAEGSYAYDALADGRAADRLLELLVSGAEVETDEGRVDFDWVGGPVPAGARGRPIAAEQSNSSLVYGENAILKAYRRLEAGENPELEMLRFLGDRGFRRIPALLGWYEYGGPTIGATLGVVQEFVADGRDGWELTLDGLSGDGDSLLGPLRELGAAVGEMHAVLGSNADDPAFAPERRGAEGVAGVAAGLDEEIGRLFAALPDDERLAPIAGRGEELREVARGLGEVEDAGSAIRVHGDLHLGQVLRSDRGWTILDFEGEPARPLAERRAKHSPLRDVAGVLRSLAYAPAAAAMRRSVEGSSGHGHDGEDASEAATSGDGPGRQDASARAWEERARGAFLDGYLDAVDEALLPADRADLDRLLALHELEKVVYELRYELDHRPDWVAIPAAGIARLLDVGAS